MSNELLNVDRMSMEELDILQTQIMSRKMSALQEKIEQLESNQIKSQTEYNIRFSEFDNKLTQTESKIEVAKDIAVSNNRVNEPNHEYVNQSTLGSHFNVSISSVRMGKLLKVVGIAQSSKNKTQPYREHIPSLAKTKKHKNYCSYEWHSKNCMSKIDMWLKQNGLYDEFYMIDSEKEMELYIDYLYRNCN